MSDSKQFSFEIEKKCDPLMNPADSVFGISNFIDELDVSQDSELDFNLHWLQNTPKSFYPSPTSDTMSSPTSSSSGSVDEFVMDEMQAWNFADILDGAELPGQDQLIDPVVQSCTEEDLEKLFESDNIKITSEEKDSEASEGKNGHYNNNIPLFSEKVDTRMHNERPVVSKKNEKVYSLRSFIPPARKYSIETESSEDDETTGKHQILTTRSSKSQAQTRKTNSTSGKTSFKKQIKSDDDYAKRPALATTDDIEVEMDRNKKAAVQAKLNREKKKAYINDLEKKVSSLTSENHEMKKSTNVLSKENQSLKEEVAYLKEVIANQSVLAGLLQNIGQTKGVSLATSFSGKRKIPSDHDYGVPRKQGKKDLSSLSSPVTGGVCLHVDKNNVSLEFCSKCSRMAAQNHSGEVAE